MSEFLDNSELGPKAAAGFRFAVVVSRFNADITEALLAGVQTALAAHGASSSNIFVYEVPGSFELPMTVARLIDERFDAIICLGAIIKGETPHFEIISKATINAIMDLSVKFKKPIGNGIITCLNKKQALERADPTKRNKGGEAARAVLSVLGILKDETK